MNSRKNGIVAAVCIMIILIACMFYVQQVQRSIYKESSVHLQELYSQVNETFTSLEISLSPDTMDIVCFPGV